MKCEECFFALLSINDDDAKLHCGNCASMYWMQDMRRADDAAWIRMDEPLPLNLRVFPEGDDRARDIILFPDQCEDETP